MDYAALVAGLESREPTGLAPVYRVYADRLYDYCQALLSDPDQAADALHDAVVLATQQAGLLRDPQQLGAWLYALARLQCGHRRSGRDRSPSGGAEAETGELVATVVEQLPAADREVWLLGVRHGLPATEIALVLGVPADQVPARLENVQARLVAALGVLGEAEERLRAYAEAPFPAAPRQVWPRLQLNCFDPGLAAERAALLRRAGRFDPDTGFPRPRASRRRQLAAAAAVAGTLVVLLAAGAAAVATQRPLAAGVAEVPAGSGPPVRSATAEPTPSAAASLTPGPTSPPVPPVSPGPVPPAPSPTPTLVRPAPSPAPTSAPALVVTATAEVQCVLGGWLGYRVAVAATASEPLAEATLLLAAGGDPEAYQLSVDGTGADGRTSRRFDGELEWWVEAVTADGNTAGTAPLGLAPDC